MPHKGGEGKSLTGTAAASTFGTSGAEGGSGTGATSEGLASSTTMAVASADITIIEINGNYEGER
jgi:hypothetical protein